MKFSVLISVYQSDSPIFFGHALQSVLENTVQPTEIVLVCDGKLTAELDQVIDRYCDKLPINLIKLDSNVGLGRALQVGLKHCKYEWVARFDADDLCCIDRFEKQIAFSKNNPAVDIFGGQIIEFSDFPEENNTVKKRVPLEHKTIKKYAKSRNPINHMTVMFRKSTVLEAGNYQYAPLYEDYDLWVRMLLGGKKFANLKDTLVYARTGKNMYERRGGLQYAKQEIRMQTSFYKLGFISHFSLIKNLAFRIPVRLMPNKLRGTIYSILLRKQI